MKPILLIIEDDKFINALYKRSLYNDTFKIIIAEDGLDGEIKAKTKLPKLILLDAFLPKKNGYEVIRELFSNKKTKNIPIIVMTNRDDISLQKLKKYKNVKEILLKVNLDLNTVQQKIREYIT